tara:strand:- start:401 stop:661 length:261 start_codon:yes stop_codon:yes gene_type:complete
VVIFLSNIIFVVFLIFIISFILKKYNFLKRNIEILEFNPELKTEDYDQHVRRLNKFRKSNYKGIVYYFSKKGGLYYYSENNVRIYI